MHTLREYSMYGRWCSEMIVMIVLTATALSILLMMLLPNEFPRLRVLTRGNETQEADAGMFKHLGFEPGFTRSHGELGAAQSRLVILVASAPAHAPAREAIRATWGRTARRANIPLAFVLGAAPELRDALDREDAQHGDIIQGRFHDSYSNLTLKTLSMLEWVSKYCEPTMRMLKTDDDMFLNVDRIYEFVEAAERRYATRSIWGDIENGVVPVRDPRFKYSVPLREFSGAVYPRFAAGHGFVVTADAAPALLAAARGVRFLRLEDVFVTGVLAQRAGIALEHSDEFVQRPATDACGLRRAMFAHDMRFHEQFDRYAKLLDPDVACPK